MALIDCPECGGQVSDRAPTCPHCGVPIAHTAGAETSPQPASGGPQATEPAQAFSPATAPAMAAGSATASSETIEPFRFRLAGRRIPIAGLLFWGGMVVGVILKFAFPPAPDAEPELWRRLPWAMIWVGVLWFAVTEFTALIRNKLRNR